MEKKTIYQKLFDIKSKLPKVSKDADGYGYKYATLGNIQDILKEPFEEQGLIVINSINDGKVYTDIIDVATGDKVTSFIEIGTIETKILKDIYDKKTGALVGKSEEFNSIDPQGLGSAITYYRRYNLLALLDLEVEDDDGAGASNKAKAKTYNNYGTNKKKEENKWYNDFDKHKEKMIEEIKAGKTAKQIIASIISKGYKISKETKSNIENLELDYKN